MRSGTSFVGRREITRQLTNLIDEEPLVTLTGAGGIGKTRLATQFAASRADSGDITAVVELSQTKPGDDLELALARQLGHSSIDTFVVGLEDAKALIVVDNCEHVLEEAASLVARLLEHPNVRVLATSRAPLSIAGEYVVALGPLRVSTKAGDETTPAFELFVDRATNLGASWLDAAEQRAAVAEIVRRLDGVPLAIELAAARSRVIGPTDLLKLLPRQLDLLDNKDTRSGASGMREAVQTSYEPMDPDCQRAFRALSLIPQGLDLELAHAVTAETDQLATLDLLTQLIDRSLVYTMPGADGELVYRLLEPVRAFGLEQLHLNGEADDVRHRYVDAVCAFAHQIVVATATSFSGKLVNQIAQRYSHLLQAIELTLELDDVPKRAYQLLLPFYAPTKAPRREQALLAAKVRQRWPDQEDPFRAAAYAIMGHIALWAGNDDPTPYANEALEDPGGTRIAKIIAYRVLAFYAAQAGDRDAALSHVEAALDIAASRGGSFERELKVTWASLVEDPDQVTEAIEQAEAMGLQAAESGEFVPLVWAASVCVHHHLRRGEIRDARSEAERALTFAVRATSPWPTMAAERALGFVCAAEQDWDAARDHFRSSLDSVIGSGDIEGVTVTMRSAAVCAHHCGREAIAGKLWSSVPTRYRATTLPPLFTEAEHYLQREFGEPLPLAVGDSIRIARQGLAPPAPALEEAGQGGDRRVYRFNGYQLDADRHELRLGDADVHVEPQVFDVLLRLIEDAGNLVSREQLMDDVWGSRFVSASALTSRIKSARAAVGDDGKTQQVIRTVHGRGFTFVADLDERPVDSTGRSVSDQPVSG